MKFIVSFLISALLIPFAVKAETVYLKDGTTISGKIISIGEKSVVISTSIGERTIDSEKVIRVGDEVSGTLTGNLKPTEPLPVKTNADWRMQQRNGLGFGLGATSLPGVVLFYDHNLSGQSQWHVQLDTNVSTYSNWLGEEILSASRNMILTTYRHFPSANSGFYLGVGGGYASSKLKYTSSVLFSSAPYYEYTATMSGGFVLGEAGWQAKDGYYFHVGIQPAAYIFSNDNYDANKVPNTSNHRSVANQEHNKLKELTQLSLGFGWFF